MKGVILAGGKGARLAPLTDTTNKHLLDVGDKSMIIYPLNTLREAGITDIMIITGPHYAGDFMKLLGSGHKFGVDLTYRIQDQEGGIAQALGLAENFVHLEPIAVILGDNIFEDNLEKKIKSYDGEGAKVFLKQVPDPQRFGVAQIRNNKIIKIEEKPLNPKSTLAVTGLYLYESSVFGIIKTLKPSERKELEITDVNNHYVENRTMCYSKLKGNWSDAGTHESLAQATQLVKNSRLRNI